MLSILATTIWQLLSRTTAEMLTLARIASAVLRWCWDVTNAGTFGQDCEVTIANENVTSAMRKHMRCFLLLARLATPKNAALKRI